MTSTASSPATRALADAMAGHVRDTVDADNPIQGRVGAAPNWTTMTVVVVIDGVPSAQPFSNDYTPVVGDLVWLRGPAGAKTVTDRVGGKATEDVVNADRQTVRGHQTVQGNQAVEGASTVAGNQTVTGAQTVGSQTVRGAHRVNGNGRVDGRFDVEDICRGRRIEAEEHVLSDTMGCNILGVGRVNGPVYGNTHGTHFGPTSPQVQGPVGPVGPPGPPGPVGPPGPPGPPSERALKTGLDRGGPELMDAETSGALVDALDVYAYRYRPGAHPEVGSPHVDHVGLMVDDLLADPMTAWLVTEPDAHGVRTWRSFDVIGVLAAEVKALRARVSALEPSQPSGQHGTVQHTDREA